MKNMLLTVDVGNTNIVFGLFNGDKLVKIWRTQTEKPVFPGFNQKIEKTVVASVVPKVNAWLKKQVKTPIFFVNANNIPLLKVKLKNKKEIGADRVVDALAAYIIYGGPAIVVDFGTATTFDVITEKGEYLGGAIAPGILLARDALYEKTAKLPKITLKAPEKVIGKNTLEAMRSGLVYGYAALVEGMVRRIRPNAKVIATGGLAQLICKQTDIIDTIDQDLTLKGLNIIGNYE